jgi:multiple sugar transport system ATP-binding protein
VTSGTIRIGDRIVNDLPPRDRDVAMVFQNYALYPHMSVAKNLGFGLKVRGVPAGERDRRVAEAARMLGIEQLLRRKPAQLSGGQRQRVALGRAIVREPAAFLFDEPLSNLDAQLRLTTRAELKRLHQRLQTTSIYVTHDQEEAMTLGDRIVVMHSGVIYQADTPTRTYQSPANRFVAGFIGTPTMNFFDGALQDVAGDLVFKEAARSGMAAGNICASGSGNVGNLPSELTLPENGFTLLVSAAARERLSAYNGKPVVLGIRPEHLKVKPADGATAPIQVVINIIEPLGSQMDVCVSTCLHDQVVARVEAQEGLQAGMRMTLFVDPRKVHFFAPGETGMNLSQTSEPFHAIA